MEFALTRDADKLVCLIYKNYLEKRGNGVPKAEAKYFGGSDLIQEQIVPDWLFEDVDETCRELSRKGLLEILFADNVCNDVVLSDDAIIYMEGRFKRGLSTLVDYLSKIIP